MAVESQLEVHSKPIAYLLAIYGVNVDAMISQKISVVGSIEDNQAESIHEKGSPIRGRNQSPYDHLEAGKELADRNRSRSASKSPVRANDKSLELKKQS